MVRRLAPSILALVAVIGVGTTASACEDLSNLTAQPDPDAAPTSIADVGSSGDGADASATNDGGVDAASTSDASDTGAALDAKDAAPIGCNGVLACERVIFVTSLIYGSNLGGLLGADAKCQSLADATDTHPRVKGRTFRAWLSTLTTPAAGRHPHGSAKYIRPDNNEIASSWTDLVDGTLTSPVAVNQKGMIEPSASVWTGTGATGASSGTSFCNDWNGINGGVGQTGMLGSTNSAWTSNAGLSCAAGTAVHLYCVEY